MVAGDDGGQATVEFAIVALVFLAIVVGLAAVGVKLSDGLLVRGAESSEPYAVDTSVQATRYIMLF